MTFKILAIKIALILFFLCSGFAEATGAGECSTRNDCNDCPRKTVSDCACFCRSDAGNDPGCTQGNFNGFPNGQRCVGDLNCGNLSRCVVEECGCGSRLGFPPSSYPPLVNPTPSNFNPKILGRVFIDNNRNGSFDQRDVLVQSSPDTCGLFEVLNVKIRALNVNTGAMLERSVDRCNSEPYYQFAVDKGAYNLELILPDGWMATTPESVSVSLIDADRHVWFGVIKSAILNCSFSYAPDRICLDKDSVIKASYAGKFPSGPFIKWESGCLAFADNSHVFVSEQTEVKVKPSSLGPCEVKVSASLDGINYVSCGRETILLDECKVTCGSISVSPSIVKAGESAVIEINPRGEAPFSFSWNSVLPVCKIEPDGNKAKIIPSDVPKINGVDSSCPISVSVRDKNLGLGAVCSVNVGVVPVTEDSGINNPRLSWFKTVGGDVISYSLVSVNVPLNNYFATYFVKVGRSSLFDLAGGRIGSERASMSNWYLANLKLSRVIGSDNFFDYFTAYYPTKLSMVKSELSKVDFDNVSDALVSPTLGVSGLDINEKVEISDGRVLRFYINGDLNIKNNIELLGDSVALFVVRGNLNISADVTEVNGAFLVDGTVNLTNRFGSNNGLVLKGILAVSSRGRMFGLYRNVNDSSIPSEIFVYEPKYLVRLLNILSRPNRVWLEVAP